LVNRIKNFLGKNLFEKRFFPFFMKGSRTLFQKLFIWKRVFLFVHSTQKTAGFFLPAVFVVYFVFLTEEQALPACFFAHSFA